MFEEVALPPDVDAIWWPRFTRLAPDFLRWERERQDRVTARRAEARAMPVLVGETGVTLSGYADRIDLLPAGFADILDYKTGSSPSKAQAHTLLAPQLALEGALLMRGAFQPLGALKPDQLAYVRLKPNGSVEEDSILEIKGKSASVKSAEQLSNEAWARLEKLLDHYNNPEAGYVSRALPFKVGDFGGDYDHLARVLEWSSGPDAEDFE